MKAEGHPITTPKLPPNGKLLSFKEYERTHLGYNKRKESETTGRAFRWEVLQKTVTSGLIRKGWVSEDVCEARITGRGEGSDPKGSCQPVTQEFRRSLQLA